jgi:hypothetical protein
MIPATLMYREQLRSSFNRTLGVTVGVALTSAIIIFPSDPGTTFPEQVGYQLIVSFCVGVLFWFLKPLIRFYSGPLKPASQWTFRILSAAAILNLGVFIGLTILAWMGVMPWSLLGSMFWSSVAPTTVIGVLCYIGFSMYDSLQYRAQYETAQARLSSLESRIRPHFLFNTLNSIASLIPEDPDAAERMTIRLSALLRYSLDATLQSKVPLQQELKVATDYLEIEKTRFGALQYSIDVPPELMSMAVPPFCLQTLVENSVKYGGGEIRVRAHNGNGRMVLQVWDSGNGFPENAQMMTGHGLDNLKGRLEALWGSNAEIEFPRDAAGTAVQVSLPAEKVERQ